MSDDKKPYKVRVTPDALREVPDADRQVVMGEIEKAFAGLNVGDPLPGEPVLPVPTGTRVCPQCRGPLEEGPLLEMHEETQQVLDCAQCDRAYIERIDWGGTKDAQGALPYLANRHLEDRQDAR
jgi:hypothetical protein